LVATSVGFAPIGTDQAAAARVLLAEDDPEFRSLLADLLREDGHEVIEAEDGTALLDRLAEALASARGLDSYDLVVTDLRMPGYTAFDVMLGMRRTMADTPFIVITAFGDVTTYRQAEQLGAIAVLDKPLDLDELRSVVSRALSRRPPLPY
jgi:DNA-binding NtrC family response regulator